MYSLYISTSVYLYSPVGGFEPTPLKNMKVNWDDEIPNIWEHKNHGPNYQAVTQERW